MNEETAIKLYEHPKREADLHTGHYTPTDVKGWDYNVGDTIDLEDVDGGFVQGTIERIDPKVHVNAKDGERFKLAVVVIED